MTVSLEPQPITRTFEEAFFECLFMLDLIEQVQRLYSDDMPVSLLDVSSKIRAALESGDPAPTKLTEDEQKTLAVFRDFFAEFIWGPVAAEEVRAKQGN